MIGNYQVTDGAFISENGQPIIWFSLTQFVPRSEDERIYRVFPMTPAPMSRSKQKIHRLPTIYNHRKKKTYCESPSFGQVYVNLLHQKARVSWFSGVQNIKYDWNFKRGKFVGIKFSFFFNICILHQPMIQPKSN